MHGGLVPGEHLTLRGLGSEFGVSMTPAREAVPAGGRGGPDPVGIGPGQHAGTDPERIEELAAIQPCWNPNWPAGRCRGRIWR